MLRPAITQIITKNESYYSLVIGVAKRARQITEELYQESLKDNLKETKENTLATNHEFIKSKDDAKIKKPVQMAVDDFASGRYKIVECQPDEEPEE
jgi:DNA-directed RNA polymerase subunit omega